MYEARVFPMMIKCSPPALFSAEEFGRFKEMVISGAEVAAAGLDARIRAAAYLIFLYDRDDLLCRRPIHAVMLLHVTKWALEPDRLSPTSNQP